MIVFVYRDSSQYNDILYEINDVKKKKKDGLQVIALLYRSFF